jgi:hypothetical protein
VEIVQTVGFCLFVFQFGFVFRGFFLFCGDGCVGFLGVLLVLVLCVDSFFCFCVWVSRPDLWDGVLIGAGCFA